MKIFNGGKERKISSDSESSNGSVDCKTRKQNQSLSAVDLSQDKNLIMDERKELLPISSDSESSNGSVDCKERIQTQSLSAVDPSQDKNFIMDERKELLPISSDSESSNGSVDCKERIQTQSLSAVDPSQDKNLITDEKKELLLKSSDIGSCNGNVDCNIRIQTQSLNAVDLSQDKNFIMEERKELLPIISSDSESSNGSVDCKERIQTQSLSAVDPSQDKNLITDEKKELLLKSSDIGSCNGNVDCYIRIQTQSLNAVDLSQDADSINSEPAALHGAFGEIDLSTNLPKDYSSESPLVNFSDTSVNSGSSIEGIETKSSPNTAKNSRPESPIISSNDSSLEKAEDLSPKFPKKHSSESPLVNYSDSSTNSGSNIEVIETKSSPNIAKNSRPESLIITSNDSSLEKTEDLSETLPKNYSSESPLVISSDSSIEVVEMKSNSNSVIHVDDSTLDVNEAADSGQKSAPASLPDCNFEVKDNLTNTLEISEPTSPASTVDSNSDTNDIETVSRAPKKNLSLPYFHLPNPDLDEFITETERNLHIPDNTSASSIPRRTFEPKDKSDIVFLFDSDASKSSSKTTDASSIPRRTFEPKDKGDIVFLVDSDASKSSSKTTENTSCCSNEYQRMLSSMEKLDDSKSPGIKRLVLKDYLKKKIEEKKVLNFERSRELAKVDDEEEIENEETMFESESSGDDDIEEPTVSFDKEKMDSADMNGFNTGSLELSNDVDHVSDDDSDDEDFGLPKAKKVHILEDESSDESYLDLDNGDFPHENVVDYSPTDPQYEVPATSNCSDIDYSQSSLTKELTNVEDDYDQEKNGPGMEINSSIPSYQPGGGFNSEEDQDFDRKESQTPEKIQARDKYLMNKNSGNRFVLEEAENERKSLGLSLEDLPISQQSDLFSTQDLETLCSGVFKDGVQQKASSEKESDQLIHELDDGPQEKIQDFFDVEAELSGEDNEADDEEQDSDEGNELDLVDDHEILSDEELRDEIADLHMKKIRDEDDEMLKDLKEKFLDDGELNDEGEGRKRKFAWLNNDTPAAIGQDSENSSSDSDEALEDNWASKCKEKAKWLQENAEEDLTGDIVTSYKKPQLKFNIIGKSGFSQNLMESSKRNSFKRPRGSYLSLDDSEASLVLKKLKTSDDSHGGSRTTKHFVFRNEATIETVPSKESSTENSKAGPSSSVFNAL